MTTPGTGNTSQNARLLLAPVTYAVGWQQQIFVAQPAAGAGWSRKTDGRYFERLVAVTFVLTTSAVVANRFPALTLADNNGKTITSVPAGNSIPASTGLNVFLTIGAPAYDFGAGGGSFGYLPDILTPPDWAWSCSVAGQDVGDQLSGIVLLVQQYPNDAAIMPAAG